MPGSDDSHLNYLNGKLPKNFGNWSGLAKSQFLETSIFMSGYLLSSQGDRVAMGNSVEGRYPFLDYRVIEFCNRLPDSFKLNGLNEKFILKKISKGKIPASITQRSKQAFRAPISNSFCSSKSPSNIQDMLSTDKLKDFGLFNPEKVEKLIRNINNQTAISETDQMAITGIVSTQLLYNLFIRSAAKPDVSVLANYKLIKESEN